MPRISTFHGITIRMFFNEDFHPGKPHFHAEHAGVEASFEIASLRCLAGELIANWKRARNHRPLEPVDPLR